MSLLPIIFKCIVGSGRMSWSWFGRLGAGDILARFKWGKVASAHRLLAKTAQVFGKPRGLLGRHEQRDDKNLTAV